MAETRQHYFRLSPIAETRQHRPPASTSQVLALALLAPLSAFLLFLSAITLTGNVVGIALSTPLFVIFSPILLPAVLLIGFAVAGFLTSAAFGLTSLASFTWMANHLRLSRLSEQLEYVKNSAQDTISHAAQSMKETGEGVLMKVQEAGQEVQAKAQESRNEAQIEKDQNEKAQREKSQSQKAQREKDQNEKSQSEKAQSEKSQREKRSS